MKRITKKFSKLITVIMLSLCTAVMGFSGLAATKYVYTGVATTKVNLRSGPSTSAKKVGTLEKGKQVTLVQSIRKGTVIGSYTADMNYYKLSTGEYVAANYIKATKTAVEVEDTETDDEATDETQYNEEGEEELSFTGSEELSIEESEEINVSDDGSALDIEEIDNAEEIVPTEEDASTANENGTKMIVTASTLKVREKPSTSATVISTLKRGTVVVVVETIKSGSSYNGTTVQGKWCKLSTGGFVSANYLGDGSSTIVTTSSSSTKKVKVATAKSDITMYSKPMTLATKKGTMKKGSSYTVSATYSDGSTVSGMKVTGTWYKLSNGYYVQSSGVTISTKNESVNVSTTTTTLQVGDKVKAKNNVNVRKEPNTSATILSLMTAGTSDIVVEVIQNGEKYNGKTVSGCWVKLQNKAGFVRADYLSYDLDSGDALGNDETTNDVDLDGSIPIED